MANNKNPSFNKNYKDSQNFEIDIDQLYNDFIKVIDDSRSVVNISDPNNQNILKKFTSDSFTGSATTSSLKPEKTAQESRCHAFYRIIGFPVASNNNRIYNPGLDIIIEKDRKLTIDKKVEIANNPLPGFQSLSNDREKYVNNNLKIFSNNQSIDAQVLALSSKNIRDFVSPFKKNSDAVENPFKSDNQSYEINKNSIIGKNSKVPLIDFKDNNNNSYLKFNSKRSHIIKPFIVDARIDLSTPSAQKVAVPFVKNNSQLKVSETISVKRPLIEKIIIDRFSVTNQIDDSGTLAQNTVDYIKNVSSIKNEQIVKDISSGDLYKLTEKQEFVKYLNIIRETISILVEAQQSIEEVQSKYYWLPIPSTDGPENGSTINPVFSNLSSNFITERDAAIISLRVQSIIDQIDIQIANLNGTPDVANYSIGNFTTTFDHTTSSSLGDTNASQLQKLIDNRKHDMTIANNLLRTIEIIMGEFAGFGLCDIIAVMASLYIMPKESLLGFLDEDAFIRAKLVVHSLPEEKPTHIVALNDLTKTVKGFYDLMDDIYRDIRKTNGL